MMFGQGQWNIDLDYSYTLNAFSLLYRLTSRSHAATISKYSIIITFSHIKAKVAKCDIAVKLLNVNLGLSFEQSLDETREVRTNVVDLKALYSWIIFRDTLKKK